MGRRSFNHVKIGFIVVLDENRKEKKRFSIIDGPIKGLAPTERKPRIKKIDTSFTEISPSDPKGISEKSIDTMTNEPDLIIIMDNNIDIDFLPKEEDSQVFGGVLQPNFVFSNKNHSIFNDIQGTIDHDESRIWFD